MKSSLIHVFYKEKKHKNKQVLKSHQKHKTKIKIKMGFHYKF